MPDRIPVILDTDIGSDIDDAVCLAYLLKQSRCDLLGVTTVTGDTSQRAALAQVVCDAAGRNDVPVHAGASGPIYTGPGQPHVPQHDAIKNRGHQRTWEPNTALEFIRSTIRSRPGEVTLLAIGPLTNLGLLFAADPEIPSLLKELVLMCGVFTAGNGHGPGSREWNALCDPLATAITYKARPPRFTSIGLEVTTKCVLEADECRRRFAEAGGPLGIVADMAEVWFRAGARHITFHDPLAGAVVFEPDICDYADGLVTVEATSEPLGGLTAFQTRSDDKPHRVATQVRPDRFFEHYFEVVNRRP